MRPLQMTRSLGTSTSAVVLSHLHSESKRGILPSARVVDADPNEVGRVGGVCLAGTKQGVESRWPQPRTRALSQMLCSFLHICRQSSKRCLLFVKKGKRCPTCFFSTFIFLLCQTPGVHTQVSRDPWLHGSMTHSYEGSTHGCLLSLTYLPLTWED